MTTVTLQFGQCGNQIGRRFYSTLEEDIKLHKNDPPMVNKWFNINRNEEWEPRSVLVDTETKVIHNISSYSKFKFKNIIAKSLGGSANNWAYGYFNNGKSIVNDVLKSVRSEVEKSDFLTSFLSFYSLSGGTGSGVGSYVLQKLRDEYPKKTIACKAVLSSLKGDISIQSYNTILNLANLYSVSDCTMIFENDRLFYICNSILDQKQVCFGDINKIICYQLASVHQPISNVTSFNVLDDLTSHPSLKFLTVKSEPLTKILNPRLDSSQAWSALLKAITKESRYDLAQKNINKSKFKSKTVSSSLISRGLEKFPETCLNVFKENKDIVKWMPKEERFKSYHHNSRFMGYDRYLTLVANTNSVCIPLESVVSDAWTSFTHGAYLHHYKKYGLEEDLFLESFQIIEDLLNSYKNL